MDAVKTKSLRTIERKMEGLDRESFRFHVLESAKNFKRSWIELGRALSSVWKDKLFREWGYTSFEGYAAREIGIRKQTAMKLLRSYFFLEKEEPHYLKGDYAASANTAALPAYESIDVLRQAKNKKTLDDEGYAHLKKEVFEKGKPATDVRRSLTAMIRQRQEVDPEEAREQKRVTTVKRFLSVLKSLKQEIEISKLVPSPIIKDATSLIKKLEEQL